MWYVIYYLDSVGRYIITVTELKICLLFYKENKKKKKNHRFSRTVLCVTVYYIDVFPSRAYYIPVKYDRDAYDLFFFPTQVRAVYIER